MGLRFIGVIPARLNSGRFPGKVLEKWKGTPIIEHVYKGAVNTVDKLVVATDSDEIEEVVHGFGGQTVRTTQECNCGTERVAYAYNHIRQDLENPLSYMEDVVINIQGDLPTIDYQAINTLKTAFRNDKNYKVGMATLVNKRNVTLTQIRHVPLKGRVTVVVDKNNYAMYFSRSMLPGRKSGELYPTGSNVLIHIGVYGFRPVSLFKFVSLPRSDYEIHEGLEQLRWLEAGFKIKVKEVNKMYIPVDTVEDLKYLRSLE